MHRVIAPLSLVCLGAVACAQTEHFDALLMINPEGELVTGLVDFDAQQALATEQRVFDATFDIIPLGAGLEASSTDVPGFNALLPSNPSLPAGFSTLPPNTVVSFDANALEIGGATANLFFWDGTSAPAFTPASATLNISKAPNVLFSVDLDGSSAPVDGFDIDITNTSGGLHKHVDFTIFDSQLAPRGFYLWSFTLSAGAQEAAPVYFVHALGGFDQAAYDDAVAFVRETFVETRTLCEADFNQDGFVDIVDFGVFGSAFNAASGDPAYDERADFNGDGAIDIIDFGVFGSEFGSAPAVCFD